MRRAQVGLALAVLTVAGSCTHHHRRLATASPTTTTNATIAAGASAAACCANASAGAGATPAPTTAPLFCAGEPPLALGYDAYRNLGELSYLDLTSRAETQTTADPAGQNADDTNVVRRTAGGGDVLLDQAGPGVITFLRMQEARGAPWQLTIDNAAPRTITQSGNPPFELNPDQSHGSSVIMTPIPFEQSAVFASSAKNGNFYALLRRLPYGTPLPSSSPGDVPALVQRGPTAFLPPHLSTTHGTTTLRHRTDTTIADLRDGQRQIRWLHFRVPMNEAAAFGNSVLKIWWGGEVTPSVLAPVKFAAGDGAGVYQPPDRPLVNGLFAQANSNTPGAFDFDLYWPMPYQHEARIAISPSGHRDITGLSWSVATEPFDAPANWWAPLHATYTSFPQPAPGQDMTFLDVTGSGRIVGTVINFGQVGTTLEGNARIYLDDANTPQVQSTGTEEWGLGGDYWYNGQQVTLPLGGLPSADTNPPGTDVDGAALYRFLVADSIPFDRRARVTWEHGAGDQSNEPYRAVIFWYGTPATTAVASDTFDPGNAGEAGAHAFTATGTDSTTTVTGGYDYQDQAAPLTKTVLSSTGTTSWTMSLAPGAFGAFLRRTYDASSANQRADVFIDGSFAGTWYNAGTITATDPERLVRRFVDDEFPLPSSLIKGKRTFRIEVRNRPVAGVASAPWNAANYQLYSVVPRPCP